MGLFLTRMYEALAEFSSETSYRVFMLGLDQAGKTTILYKVKLDEIVKTIPTIGFNVETVKPAPGVSFVVWDVGGEEKIRALWAPFFQNCHGFFFVVDSSDRDRFQEARGVLFRIIRDEFMASIPFIVIANKSDLLTAAKPTELIEQLNLDSISKQRWHFQSACAITGEGITEAMRHLAQLIKDNRKSGTSSCIKN